MRRRSRVRVVSLLVALVLMLSCLVAKAQVLPQGSGTDDAVTTVTVRGRVLNKVTMQPISRALVTTVGDEYATMSDDQGRFELKITQHGPLRRPGGFATGPVQTMVSSTIVGRAFTAKKPGYLTNRSMANAQILGSESNAEVTIYLIPEALIVGHVNVPGAEGEVRIQCELYRLTEGKESWSPSGNVMSWGSGEFRFSELQAGTYKLITHEQMDLDSRMAMPGEELFGYPPVYYPNTTDFALASPIVVKAGETAQANLTVARRAYYPVRIPLTGPTGPAGVNITVHPLGHWGPGWSLGYNPSDGTIEGLLPDGSYTAELEAQGENAATGIANFVVKGGPLEGTLIHLVPNASVPVNVRSEFSAPSEEDGRARANWPTGAQQLYITVVLRAMDETARGRDVSGNLAYGPESTALTLKNVHPGRYRVSAHVTRGYAASIDSGGVDLLKEPLVVGMGSAIAPLEITLRNDGADVTVTVEDGSQPAANKMPDGQSQQHFVYLIPVGPTISRPPIILPAWNRTVQFKQVPPGEYLALAYEEAQEGLPLGDEEFVKRMEEKGQRIQVDAGTKLDVKLKAIAGSAE